MKYLLGSLSAVALLGACSSESSSNTTTSASDVVVVEGVTIENAYALIPLAGRDVTSAYFDITSVGADRTLIAAASENVGSAEVHNHFMVDGRMAMREVESVDLPAGETVSFKPRSLHVMLFGVPEGLAEGDEITIDLTLTSGDETETVTVNAPLTPLQ